MKKLLLIIPYLFVLFSYAENPPYKMTIRDDVAVQVIPSDTAKADTIKYWKFSTKNVLNFSQVSLTNWAEGGESAISGVAFSSIKWNYLKNSFKMDNYLMAAYGITWNGEQGLRKTEDRFEYGGLIGYEIVKDLFYSFVVNLKSQFANGYKYPNDSVIVSSTLSPANLFLSLGLQYKPVEYASIFISPASGKFVFVMNQELADKGAFGVQPAIRDTAGNVLVPGSNVSPSFGVNILLTYNRDILKNVNFDTRVNIHNNYMDDNISNRWNMDVDWESALSFKINSYLSSNLFMRLLYDDDIPIPTYEKIGDTKVEVGKGPKVQFKENFGIGITFKV